MRIQTPRTSAKDATQAQYYTNVVNACLAVTACAGITIWGEGYLNFGVVGALLVPMLWVAAVQWIYRRCVLLGEYGLIFYASTHYTILNSLASNVASPFALFCEYALILVLVNILIVFIARTRRGAA